MAHRRKEFGFDNRGSKSRVAGVREAAFSGHAIGDVVNESDKELMLFSSKCEDRGLEGNLAAVAAPPGSLDPTPFQPARVLAQMREQLLPDLGSIARCPGGRRLAGGSERRRVASAAGRAARWATGMPVISIAAALAMIGRPS